MKEKDLGIVVDDNSLVTHSKDGKMSKEDKIKLDSIDTGGLRFCKNIYDEWGFIDPNNHNFTSFSKRSAGLKDIKDICSITRKARQNTGASFNGAKVFDESFVLPWTVKILIINFSAFYYWWQQSKLSNGEIIIDAKIDGSYIIIKNDNMCSQKTSYLESSEVKNDVGGISSIHILTDSGENLRVGTTINVTVKCNGNATNESARTQYIMSAYGLTGEEKLKI